MSDDKNNLGVWFLIVVCLLVNFSQGEKIKDLQTRMEEVELNK